MMDSYYDWEFIIVDRFSYLSLWDFKQWFPERWDVIVFKPWVNADKEYFIKRVIGIPGDELKIEDGKVFLRVQWQNDFVELDEPYLSDANSWATFVAGESSEKKYKVPDGQYFVVWDHRNASTDSRTCFYSCSTGKSEFIKKEDIVWKVWLDLGYFNFRTFKFEHPDLPKKTYPRFFSSPDSHDYNAD